MMPAYFKHAKAQANLWERLDQNRRRAELRREGWGRLGHAFVALGHETRAAARAIRDLGAAMRLLCPYPYGDKLGLALASHFRLAETP